MKEEWFSLQIHSYETIWALRDGRDLEALEWVKAEYEEHKPEHVAGGVYKEYEGFYVILMAPETDGVLMYVSMGYGVKRKSWLKLVYWPRRIT